MKKLLSLLFVIICGINLATASERYNISSGVYVLQDGYQFTVVDDNQHVCFIVSIELDRYQKKGYNVVCGSESRAAVNGTLNTVISTTVVNAFTSAGASLSPAIKAGIVKILYNKGCNYWSQFQ